ncbi:MAG: tRNA (adenosine(37)-N6)-threonylcarbamoyltransferase complex ATPase subunit type 1 TsaE [Bacteroidia bacterium]|nr:tRNA (adenosine(37)-N6)-threonylcarbamoyltransferase complex ATPase subunit type 1 TsaE [Bacteroidia bacterium]
MNQTGKKILSFQIESEAELKKVAHSLLEFCGDVRILTFYGEMGSGKTTFIKSLCRELGVEAGMSSPTFSLVNEYISRNGDKIYHFDFYRLKTTSEAIDIGVEEYFYSGCYCMIEWPEKIINLVPEAKIRIDIRAEENKRVFTFSHE